MSFGLPFPILKNQGRDFNYFQKFVINWSTFGGSNSDGYSPLGIITFPTQGLIIVNETASTTIQLSYNGNTIHDELDPSLFPQGIQYNNRVVSLFWARLTTGASATLSVRAWGIR